MGAGTPPYTGEGEGSRTTPPASGDRGRLTRIPQAKRYRPVPDRGGLCHPVWLWPSPGDREHWSPPIPHSVTGTASNTKCQGLQEPCPTFVVSPYPRNADQSDRSSRSPGRGPKPGRDPRGLPHLELADIAACLRYAVRRLDHPTLAA